MQTDFIIASPSPSVAWAGFQVHIQSKYIDDKILPHYVIVGSVRIPINTTNVMLEINQIIIAHT